VTRQIKAKRQGVGQAMEKSKGYEGAIYVESEGSKIDWRKR